MVGVKKKGKGRSKPVFRLRFGRFPFDLVICFLALTLVPVLVYRVLPPPTTPLMWLRWMEKGRPDEFPLMIKDWKRRDDISPSLFQAVIAAEDQKFFIHNGFDWNAVESAWMATILPNPRIWSVHKPENLEDRQARILQAMPRVRLLTAQKS